MREIAVVGDEGFTLGFRLAGVREVYNPPEGEYEETVEEISESADIGIVVVRQDDLDKLSKKTRMAVRDSIDPIFVQLSEEGGEEEDLRSKIRRAIGVDLWQ